MSQRKPMALMVEYDDGSRSSVSFEAIPWHLQNEILRQPFASLLSKNSGMDSFVLVEWQDGWKEVTKVDRACADINRFYVITRPEEVGRLSLNTGDDQYPELIEIERKPSEIKNITFGSTYELQHGASLREGKKVDQFYDLTRKGESLAHMVDLLKQALREEGLGFEDLDGDDWSQAKERYERIRRRIGVCATQCQQDAYDFIAYLVHRATQNTVA